MRWIRALVVFVLAAVMLPLAIHGPIASGNSCVVACGVETGLGDSNHPSPPGDCACVHSETSLATRPIQAHKGLPRDLRKAEPTARLRSAGLSLILLPVTRTPQEFLAGWQFSRRAARLPRAPASPA